MVNRWFILLYIFKTEECNYAFSGLNFFFYRHQEGDNQPTLIFKLKTKKSKACCRAAKYLYRLDDVSDCLVIFSQANITIQRSTD